MTTFFRVGSTLINLAVVESIRFERHENKRCVVLRYSDGGHRFALGTPEAAQVCEALFPDLSADEVEAEFYESADVTPSFELPTLQPGFVDRVGYW